MKQTNYSITSAIVLSPQSTSYRTYLIRLWADNQEPAIWRFSAENIHDQSRYGFSTLEELFAFLEQSLNELGQTGDTFTGGHNDK